MAMEVVGDYEYSKKDLIGHGAFAVVFKGRKRKHPNVPVAVKSITKKNLAKSQNLLSKEIKILKELADLQHENVVGLLDCKETTNHVYLVMEYCNGGDLADYLQAKGTLSEDTLSVFLRQIAGAMRALYAKGIVHRDLKPQNILLCHPGKPNPPPQDMKLKIADFGFARFLVDGVMAATLCGSPMYMAPEVIMSLQYGAKADLWSIGTIVFQCLTGKAPFQAQTPQQLKQFYERNSELCPNIPPGTSAALKDLLLKLLKRNAKDRIDFESFFNHHFLKPPPSATSSPVPVPSRSHSFSSNQSSPVIKAVSASPLSGMSSTNKRCSEQSLQKEVAMTCEDSPPEKELSRRSHSNASSNHEDFVMVPHNLPLDPTEKLVDMETTATSRERLPEPNPSSQPLSPPRPGTLPVYSASPTSEPITVPTTNAPQTTHSPSLSDKKTPDIPKPELDIGSFSPPAVQFTIGTPPSYTWRRTGVPNTPPTGRSAPQLNTASPKHRSGSASPLHFSGPGSLPTILGSPTIPHAVLVYPNSTQSSPPLPVNAPFAMTRVNTAPDFHRDVIAVSPPHPGIVQRCETDPGHFSPYRRMSTEQLFHPAFHGQYTAACGMVPYSTSQAIHDQRSTPTRDHTSQSYERSQSHPQRSSPYNTSPPNSRMYARSPPNMEGPIAFNVPELQEETLMDDHHNEILSKLSFVLDLVECIMELAQLRGMSMTSFSESVSNKQEDRFNEPQRKLEQMVLYVRALQLLSKSLQLAKEEVKLCTVLPSNSFKTVARTMNEHYHRCLAMCKQLHKQGYFAQQRSNLTPQVFSTTANKLIYNYAIELCQTAALDEFFGNPDQCFRRYTTAQILLHSLAQQAHDSSDKQLLIKYREAVEKRLYNLQIHGNMQHIHHYDFYS